VNSEAMSIGDLADAAGLSRRAIRFYVQQRLIPPPLGRGRGRHYDRSHLERLRRIGELQSAGHSLEAIRRIVENGDAPVPPPPAAQRRAPRAGLSAQLWTRLQFGEGVELHYDAARHNPTVEQLMELRAAVRAILTGGAGEGSDDTPGGQS
jgi:DNA-binding transcriptional MerR regulator